MPFRFFILEVSLQKSWGRFPTKKYAALIFSPTQKRLAGRDTSGCARPHHWFKGKLYQSICVMTEANKAIFSRTFDEKIKIVSYTLSIPRFLRKMTLNQNSSSNKTPSTRRISLPA